MKRTILLIFLLVLGRSTFAYHIAGGEMTTQFLGGNDYRLRLTLYRDCSNSVAAPFDPTIIITAYSKNTNALIDSFHMDLSNSFPLQLAGPGCIPPPAVCMEQGDYIRTIQLAPIAGGYYLVWERCCRNSTVINLATPDFTGMLFYHEMADSFLQNSSPEFNSPPLPYTCAGQNFIFSFNATDADGDSLVYALSEPMSGGYTSQTDPNPYSAYNSSGGNNFNTPPKPYNNNTWEQGFSLSNICNSLVPLTIDPATGVVEGVPDAPGLYAMAATVYEYRNGELIGIVRREIEFTVITCDDNTAPNLSPEVLNADYEIYASDTLCFDLTAVDPDGDSLYLTYSGDVFAQSPAAGLTPPYAVTTDTSGIDSVKVNFCWKTTCLQGGPTIYKVKYEVRDNGCPLPLRAVGKITIHINPVPLIAKPNLLCLELGDSSITIYKNPQKDILARYFSRFSIYRSENGGSFQLIGTSDNPYLISFTDSTAADPATNDYCYYITGTNSCGVESPASDTICSLSQINTKFNYIESVSVIDKNLVRLTWEDFPDGPYSTYVIERRINTPSSTFNEIHRLVNYFPYYWDDASVSTAESSYCYRMKNYDYCQNESTYSNEACTILLQGDASQFSNQLNWNNYREWKGGVESYALLRSGQNNGYNFAPVATLPDLALAFEDHDIPLSGGIFRYKVLAKEASGGNDAKSLSNEVELVQPPLIYLPNAFTPNGDGNNNTWGPGYSFVNTLEIIVFNRWGQCVFFSKNKEQTWDGRFNGRDCPEGVYLFKVKFSGYDSDDIIEKTGTVTLLR